VCSSDLPSAKDAVLIHPSDSILRKLYHHAFAHISTARIKGVELSTIEAMQCRCPVVIVQYDNPYRDYWGNCISTPTLDGESLQEIVTLLEDPNTRARIGQAGLEYTKALSYETTAKILGGFITEIYGASRRKLQP
jgi:glycosyltransferase involved in cell wall biosynthesis